MHPHLQQSQQQQMSEYESVVFENIDIEYEIVEFTIKNKYVPWFKRVLSWFFRK